MKRILFSTILVLLLAVGTFTTAQAITNGHPDGSDHPYVGVLFFTDGTSFWRCSGSLLAPQVVLTAGHCTDGATKAWASFETSIPPRGTTPRLDWLNNSGHFIPGVAHTAPGFCIGCSKGLVGFDTHDVGIVTLDSASSVNSYVQLPALGYDTGLPMNAPIDFVGYGVQERLVGGGQPVWTGTLTRFFAPALLIASSDRVSAEYLKISANPAQGKGGTCFGDSGGPVLQGGTNKVLAVVSFGTNGNCAGLGYYNRVDLAYALDFIHSFLP